MSTGKINPIRKTDEKACALARKLISEAKFAAIAVLEPATGHPSVTRIAVTTDADGNLIFLASDLSTHTKALAKDSRASILVGEPGRGDPLAHPRITLIGTIKKIERTSSQRDALRDIYLTAHPKSKLYIDFGDFHFFRLTIARANLNGGFAQAYELTGEDIEG